LNVQGIDNYYALRERCYIRDGIVIIHKHGILEPGTVI
jgi:hypothetical protein